MTSLNRIVRSFGPESRGAQDAIGRIPEVDLLRFLAASAVVFYHFTYIPADPGAVSQLPFGRLQTVTRFGYLGVNLFFMISGFVILWSSQSRSAGEFVISRFARLYPSFWICALLTALVVNYAGIVAPLTPRTVGLNLTMVPQMFGADYIDGVYWTLFVELKFYVIVFLVLLTGTMHHVERWIGLWLAASVACASGVAPHWLASAALYPLGSYFISGCILFLIRLRGLSAFRCAALSVSCTLAAMAAVAAQRGFIQGVDTASAIVVAGAIITFHLVLFGVSLCQILPHGRWWYALGSLTYPLYLLHNRVGKAVRTSLGPMIAHWLALAIMLTVVYAAAWMIAAVVERRGCGTLHRALLRWAVRHQFIRARPA